MDGNLAGIVESHPAGAPALIEAGEVVFYGELRAAVAATRAGLTAAGVTVGDRVALISGNDRAFVVSYLAALGVGAVVAPLNPSSPAAELERELAAITPTLVITGPAGESSLAGTSVPAVSAASLAEPEGTPAPIVERRAGDLAVLIFTAGTGGAPKAAMLTHGNLLANLEQSQRHPGRTMMATDVTLGALPLFHIFGLNVVLGLTLLAGGAVVLLDRFDAGPALAACRDHGVTVLPGVPTMFAALAAQPDASPAAMASVRVAISGAAPLPAEVAAAAHERLGLDLHEGYGLTEAAPVVTSSVPVGDGIKPFRTGGIGLPLPGVEVRLVDEEGEDALLGDPAEIWVRGPNVFAGYWNDEQASATALTPDGWLRTGDIAVLSDDGELFLVDRVKDLIIVSGFNVYPAEVEDVLGEHPAVLESGVFGTADEYSGEVVEAMVVLAPGVEVTEAELIEHCARRLARYKCPSRITFLPELPRGLTGKLLRRQLAP